MRDDSPEYIEKLMLEQEQEALQQPFSNSRYQICLQCENFFKKFKTCNKCHCFMPFKVKLSSMSCPVGKW